MDLVALFCDLDDFYQAFAPTWCQHLLPAPGRHRRRRSCLSTSEMMTLVVAFQTSSYRTFKHFYLAQVCRHWRTEFPHLVRYQRLMECLPAVLVPLAAYLRTRLETTHGLYRQSAFTGLSQPPYPLAPRVCRSRAARPQQHGLVLRLEAALRHQ
jgi:hypothetical protein